VCAGQGHHPTRDNCLIFTHLRRVLYEVGSFHVDSNATHFSATDDEVVNGIWRLEAVPVARIWQPKQMQLSGPNRNFPNSDIRPILSQFVWIALS
jgi:hypothetical protein